MPLMNSHIVEECLPFTSLRLDPEDINLSMGAGYVPDAEIQAISDALEAEIAGICTPRFLYALFDAEPAGGGSKRYFSENRICYNSLS